MLMIKWSKFLKDLRKNVTGCVAVDLNVCRFEFVIEHTMAGKNNKDLLTLRIFELSYFLLT